MSVMQEQMAVSKYAPQPRLVIASIAPAMWGILLADSNAMVDLGFLY